MEMKNGASAAGPRSENGGAVFSKSGLCSLRDDCRREYRTSAECSCAVDLCVSPAGAPQDAGKSNNQKGSRKIKQSKSREYHFPIPLVFSNQNYQNLRENPAVNRIRNRKHYSLVQGARCLRCPVCEKRLKTDIHMLFIYDT